MSGGGKQETVYRNIYFEGSAITKFNGSIDVYYRGSIFNNARHIKDFDKIYDSGKDLYIICGSCAAKKYRRLIKIK